MSIVEAHLDGATFDIQTCFAPSAQPERTLIKLTIDPPLPRAFNPNNVEAIAGPTGPIPAGLRPAALDIVAHLRALSLELWLTEQAFMIELPAPLADPASAREAIRAMLKLAEMARGERRISPYR
jgi:hypothetical protein